MSVSVMHLNKVRQLPLFSYCFDYFCSCTVQIAQTLRWIFFFPGVSASVSFVLFVYFLVTIRLLLLHHALIVSLNFAKNYVSLSLVLADSPVILSLILARTFSPHSTSSPSLKLLGVAL